MKYTVYLPPKFDSALQQCIKEQKITQSEFFMKALLSAIRSHQNSLAFDKALEWDEELVTAEFHRAMKSFEVDSLPYFEEHHAYPEDIDRL